MSDGTDKLLLQRALKERYLPDRYSKPTQAHPNPGMAPKRQSKKPETPAQQQKPPISEEWPKMLSEYRDEQREKLLQTEL